jgi:hypothetical protein
MLDTAIVEPAGAAGVAKPVRPDNLEAFMPVTDLPIDPGIRRHVLILRAAGVETFESCQGGPGHACLEPTVKFHGNAYEGFRAFSIAMNHGLPVLNLRRVYDVNEGWLQGPWWEITFRTTETKSETP